MAGLFLKLAWVFLVGCGFCFLGWGDHPYPALFLLGALGTGLLSAVFLFRCLFLRLMYPNFLSGPQRLPIPNIQRAIAGPNNPLVRIPPYFYKLHWETDDPDDVT